MKFEYKIIDHHPDDITKLASLNMLGEDGWELVTVVQAGLTNPVVQFFYKREML